MVGSAAALTLALGAGGALGQDGASAVLEDAMARPSLMRSAAASPPGVPALSLTSSDGTSEIKFSGQMQFRHVVNHREGTGIDEDDFGFEFRRLRPGVSGSVMDGKVPFAIVAEADRSPTLELLDGWVGYKAEGGHTFRAGQFAPNFTREQQVSSKSRLASDNTIAHAFFNFGRSQGVDWRYRTDQWQTSLFFGEGAGELNTPYTMDADYGITARVERQSGTDWKRHDDFQGWRGEEMVWLAGAAVSIAGGETDADGDTVRDEDYHDLRGTVDFGIEGDGWNAFAAFFAQNVDAQGVEEVNSYGLTVQGGVFVTDDVDIVAQYAWADDDADNGKLNVLTVGSNWYIHGHVIKLTVDANYALDPITSNFNSSSRGFLVDAMGEDGQFVVRTQLQLLF